MALIGKAVQTAISSPELLSALVERRSPDGAAPPAGGRYDRLIDAANRLPRPALAFGAVAVFLFAMLDPAGFAQRMAALEAAPEELWWLLGAVIATHFGAREAFHQRHRSPPPGTASTDNTPPDPKT